MIPDHQNGFVFYHGHLGRFIKPQRQQPYLGGDGNDNPAHTDCNVQRGKFYKIRPYQL